MPWWSWLLIWSFLVLALAGMLAWFAVRLFTKLMVAFDALGELGDQVADLESNLDELAPERRRLAIFANRQELAREVDLYRAERAERAQLRQDRAIGRGKLLRQAPVNQRTPPHAQ